MTAAKSVLVPIALAALAAFAGVARAASTEEIGATVHVLNLVTAEIDRDTRTLVTGDAVHQNENIEVARDGIGEIRFDDETKLALGPGSRVKLDTFVYDPAKSAGSIVMNLAKGTFRFITGTAAKPSYKIVTPQASISVRGTIFDLYVEESGRTWLLLHEGGVEVCGRNRCRDLDEPGKIIPVDDDKVGLPVRWAALTGANRIGFDNAFPFVASPPRIDPTPLLTREAILREAAPDRAPKKSDGGSKGKSRRTEKPEPKKSSPPQRAETGEPAKKKQASVPETKKPSGKKKRTATVNDKEAAKAIGLAVGVGLAIGGAKIGGGGRGPRPGGHRPGGGSTGGNMGGPKYNR